jgi:hypothetical protein
MVWVGFLGGRHLVEMDGAEQPATGRYFMRDPLLARPNVGRASRLVGASSIDVALLGKVRQVGPCQIEF